MRLPKHIMPDDYFSVTPKTDVQITALPFYIKEVGYCNDRKLSVVPATIIQTTYSSTPCVP